MVKVPWFPFFRGRHPGIDAVEDELSSLNVNVVSFAQYHAIAHVKKGCHQYWLCSN